MHYQFKKCKMDSIYLIIVVVLFALAISDLIVGVSNDAVNFLNSAIGAKAGSFKLIMAIAALGVLFGSVFSDGMMDVARNGMFNPNYFYFSEVMIIFLAVMITDIILLDSFNTLGLPTSTTVSMVSELLGAAVAVALIKINGDPQTIVVDGHEKIATMLDLINADKALTIFSGILLSVVFSIVIGSSVQWVTRLAFSFDFERRIKYLGGVWGGLAITSITYFILIKGAKHISFFDKESREYIIENSWTLMLYSFVIWTVLLQSLILLFKRFNVLVLISLVGTFALALAFAGNDLVNFIGVPLAGYSSYLTFTATPGANADTFLMTSLSESAQTDAYLLIIAGLIMVATLYLSKKAKTVLKTSLSLARQSDGHERFGSSLFARNLVRASLKLNEQITMFTPPRVRQFIEHQFDTTPFKKVQETDSNPPAFDLLRASVNMVVASALISFGTSMKLPLSTTYVTFMVAMGTSLADRAWGRESAVYRITGVLSVVGGWFFTAFAAFALSFVIAYIIHWGGIYSIGGLVILALFLIYKSNLKHKNDEAKIDEAERVLKHVKSENIVEQCTANVYGTLYSISDIYTKVVNGITIEDRRKLKEAVKEVEVLNHQAKTLKSNVYVVLKQLRAESVAQSHHYAQVLDYLRETAHCFTYIAKPSFEYFDNHHTPFIAEQIAELESVSKSVAEFNKFVLQIIDKNQFNKLDEVYQMQKEIFDKIESFRANQMVRIKSEEIATKNSILFLGLLHETKNLLLHTVNLTKAQRDFVLNARPQN